MSDLGELHDPRGLLLGTWRTWIDLARDTSDGLLWRDLKNETCSTLASESMLCFLLPAMRLEAFTLNPAARSHAELRSAVLQALGDLDENEYRAMPDIPWSVISRIEAIIGEYYDKIECDGALNFRAGTYGADLGATEGGATDPDLRIDVVDAYSAGLSVALCVMRLLAMWRREYGDHSQFEKHAACWDALMERSHIVLRGAMQGLYDSFAVELFDRSTWELRNNNGYRWADQADPSLAVKLEDLRRRLRGLGLTAGRGDEAFECGWSWGPVAPANRLRADAHIAVLEEGTRHAVSTPYAYFTWMALTGLEDLWGAEVQSAGVLDTDELAMSARLRELWQITVEYWAAIASQRDATDTLTRAEDLPWTTSDGAEDLYFSIYILGILMMGDATGVMAEEDLVRIIEEIAQRARITRRLSPPDEDPGLHYHSPGKTMRLLASAEDGPAEDIGGWLVYDVAPLLLKTSSMLLPTLTSHRLRNRLRSLIESLLRHIVSRRSGRTATRTGLPMASWDDPAGAFSTKRLERRDYSAVCSWYMTERTVEALLALAESQGSQLATPNTSALLLELLDQLDAMASESDLPASERPAVDRIRARASTQPGVALAEAMEALVAYAMDRPG